MSAGRRAEFARLIDTDEPASIGPGPREGRMSIDEIESALKSIFATTRFATPQTDVIRSLILLWHDHLDASHEIAQDIHNADGSFVHGIVHRREPDFSNAKYWFHQVGSHPVFGLLAQRATQAATEPGAKEILSNIVSAGVWDPFAFVDACQRARRGAPEELTFLRQLQKLEFAALLEHVCANQ